MTDSDTVIHNEAELFRAAACTDWDAIEEMIDTQVEPLELTNRDVSAGGFSIELLGGKASTEFRMTYPFMWTAFWRELSEVEENALADLESSSNVDDD
jgi:hypothetical protein